MVATTIFEAASLTQFIVYMVRVTLAVCKKITESRLILMHTLM